MRGLEKSGLTWRGETREGLTRESMEGELLTMSSIVSSVTRCVISIMCMGIKNVSDRDRPRGTVMTEGGTGFCWLRERRVQKVTRAAE